MFVPLGLPSTQWVTPKPEPGNRVIDLLVLSELCGFEDIREFQKAHREWVEAGSSGNIARRDEISGWGQV